MNLFRRRTTTTDAGRALAEMACLDRRERIRCRARMMRADLGLPPLAALEPRG